MLTAPEISNPYMTTAVTTVPSGYGFLPGIPAQQMPYQPTPQHVLPASFIDLNWMHAWRQSLFSPMAPAASYDSNTFCPSGVGGASCHVGSGNTTCSPWSSNASYQLSGSTHGSRCSYDFSGHHLVSALSPSALLLTEILHRLLI